MGDLNSKNEYFGNKNNNESGNLLQDFLESSNACLIDNKEPTFNIISRNYFEILDLAICSPNLVSKINNFEVLYDQDL